nr:glycoside hydrolase family 2 TIM barrel-domain containing protein [Mucilaginibacter rivuli]
MPTTNANKVSLNGTWKFKYIASTDIGADSAFANPKTDVSKWANIKTPGNWELQGFAEPFYGKNLKAGTGLYRTIFKIPATWQDQPIYIAFDGVQYGYELWVDGKFAGSFSSSYNRQTFDISRFVSSGKSATLAVKVSTRVKGWEFDTNDDWSLSGIIRDVTLFSLPKTHVKDLVVKTNVGNHDATLSVSALVETVTGIAPAKNTSVSAKLLDAYGKPVKEFILDSKASAGNTTPFGQSVKIDAPHLWTAESPYLYTLNITLKNGNNELQQYSQKIGIREITWTNGVLKLNGKPIKLRGVDHHDLSPVNGRAVTEKEMLQDLKLIREANINFIRTSHYQPHPRFIELCDSLGFYVIEEVPFGFGDEHLNDTTYLPVLKGRAKATLWRDKNHPSIIIWSVGNENPLTPICIETGKYVKSLDDTRPYCFPEVGSYFGRIAATFPDQIDILAPHYPDASTLRGYADRFNHPMVITEYAHSLGLDFDRMESLWEIMYAHPKLAGGAVWHFFDQGILRKSPEKTAPGKFTTSVWLDSVTVYDNSGNEGADGVVYANRVPQVDYWQVRKVYTPVKALDDTLQVVPGKQQVKIKLINRYDFTNLSERQCTWTLYADTTAIQSGISPMACAPHDTLTLGIDITLAQKLTASYYTLKLQFKDKQNYTFYEKTYLLRNGNTLPDFRQKLAIKPAKPVLNGNNISFGNFGFEVNQQTGMVSLKDASGSALIADGPYARMSRKTTMSEQATTAKSTGDNNPIWQPHVLTKPAAKIESISANKVLVSYNYERQNIKGQFITGTAEYTLSDSGRVDVKYHFIPNNAKGMALEAGISFLIPSSLTELRWVGKGPYPAYPGKNRLDEFGFYHKNSADINYQGNHEQVNLAVLSDAKGKGFVLVANNANVSVENAADGIIVSHNAYVSGRYNKGSNPERSVRIENLKDISGSFSIIPLQSTWPLALRQLFGDPSHVAVPFKPFYNSYDQ